MPTHREERLVQCSWPALMRSTQTLLGKEVVPDEHPLCTGGLGLLGTTPSVQAME